MQIRESGVFNCDKCGEPADADDYYFLLYNPILGTYHLCIDCSLVLERFVESIDKRIEKRGRKMLGELERP